MAPDPDARLIIVLGRNETLLDVKPPEPLFQRMFGSKASCTKRPRS